MDVNYKEKWYNVLKEKRKKSGFTQEEIATQCATYKSKWSRYESGQAYPSVTEWYVIYHYLKCSPYDFFDMEESIQKNTELVELSYSLVNTLSENRSVTLQKFMEETIIKMKHLFTKRSPSSKRIA